MSHDQAIPSFTFTIPSIHDDIDLDCRIYNPSPSTLFPPESELPWNPRGAVVAHPYAPLGGSYDDLIVLAVVEECLERGLVVGTFNFRGAPGSKGSTSWTSKSEVDDYISFAGLLINYLQTLIYPPSPLHSPSQPSFDTHLTPVPSNTILQSHKCIPTSSTKLPHQSMNLLLAGYSYGSLITMHLPPTPLLQQRFASPQPGDAQSEILARGHSLATQTLKDAQKHLDQDTRRGRAQGQVLIGGEEGLPGSRRPSRDNSRKSIDAVRRSVDHTRRSIDRSRRRLLSLRKGGGGSSGGTGEAGSADEEEENGDCIPHGTPSLEQSPLPTPTTNIVTDPLNDHGSGTRVPAEIRTSYLLISPLLGTVAGLATLSLSTLLNSSSSYSAASSSSPSLSQPKNTAANNKHHDTNNTTNLLQNPTLIIYGSGDFFTSAKKLRKWCAGLKAQAQQGQEEIAGHSVWFRSQEINGAGHFWREAGAEPSLRRTVGRWIEEVLAGTS